MMNLFEQSRVPIAGNLRTRINQIAHAWGVEQGLQFRKRLITQLTKASAAGASLDELNEMLDAVDGLPSEQANL
jgi:hypothetical protein